MILSLLLATALLGAITAQYNFAVDVNQLGTQNTFDCLRSNNFRAVFIPQLSVEVYMTPNPNSSKSPSDQVNTNGGINIRNLWILVSHELEHGRACARTATSSQLQSSKFGELNPIPPYLHVTHSLVNATGEQTREIRPGVYTNFYDWQQITNNLAGNLGSDVMLWYWNVLSYGVGGKTAPNFSDFRPFGQWQSANVKQFGQLESVCGMTLNKDVFPSSVSSDKNFTGIVGNGTIGKSTAAITSDRKIAAESNGAATTSPLSGNPMKINEANATLIRQNSASDIEGVVFLVLFFGIPVLLVCFCAKCGSNQTNAHTPIGSGAVPDHHVPSYVYPETTIGTGALPSQGFVNPVYPNNPIFTGAQPNYNIPPPVYDNAPIGSGAPPYQGFVNHPYPDAQSGPGPSPYQGVGNPVYPNAPQGVYPTDSYMTPTYPSAPSPYDDM